MISYSSLEARSNLVATIGTELPDVALHELLFHLRVCD